jgi:hypothetical protein
VCLRLFAGFTSFRSNFVFSHACSIGPVGTLESIAIYFTTPSMTLIGIEIYPSTITSATTHAALFKIGVCRG